jgi:tetratricopeptide (TPR) repeat protein
MSAKTPGERRGRTGQSLLQPGRRKSRQGVLTGLVLAGCAVLALPATHGHAQEPPHQDIRVLLLDGEYDRAARAAQRAVRADPSDAQARYLLGEAHRAVGRWEEAEDAYGAATEAGYLPARLRIGEMLLERGLIPEARGLFDTFFEAYNQGGATTSPDLVAVGDAMRHLGPTDPALFQDAIRAYERALSVDPSAPEPRLAMGNLFLEKYNSVEARPLFREVLAQDSTHPLALLGMARAEEFDGSGGASAIARRALERNPNLVPARALLARSALGLEDMEGAREEARRALDINPRDGEALAVNAGIRFLADDTAGWEQARDRALEINPRNAALFATVAELAIQHRRYSDAVQLARRAVQLDDTYWPAWGTLGMNLLREGRMAAGRDTLEAAFGGDPFNPWYKNTLDLMDELESFHVVETEHFHLVMHPGEAALLAPLAATLAEEAFDSLSARYDYEPPLPIRVELFPREADFSVRTLGLVGLGALGVSFGSVLTMDSPAARPRGSFNWGATLWHETAHAFHLGYTNHRIPRWFAEGLAVFEERHSRPGWGRELSMPFLMAQEQGLLRPVSELNRSFLQPRFAWEVPVAYFQASLVCEYISEIHGFPAILAFLDGFRDGKDIPGLVREVLDSDPESFDREFQEYLEDRFGRYLSTSHSGNADREAGHVSAPPLDRSGLERLVAENPTDGIALLALGRALAGDGEHRGAAAYLERARAALPEYGGSDGPHPPLARAYLELGEADRAEEVLTQFAGLNNLDEWAFTELARLRESRGDPAGALEALERILWIHPYAPDLHLRVADLAERAQDWDRLVLAREALVALEPVDRAQALYGLARAYQSAGRPDRARSTVLQALEIAPAYDDALELLLELRGGGE